jgi:molybdenum cofactor biosynthesis protein A
MLLDSFGRIHDYLRISLTDACNFRCTYCMPEDVHFMPHEQLMQAEEIEILARQFVHLGVKRIRLTGGEPLVRKDFSTILRSLAQLPAEITLTSNGMLIDRYLDDLLAAGVRSVNISLDSLQPETFRLLTRRDGLDTVLRHIEALLEAGIRVKVNCVVMNGVNDGELFDFIELGRRQPLHIRFIEFMPFQGNRWEGASVLPFDTMMERIRSQFDIVKLHDDVHDTTRKFKVIGFEGTFAAITTMSQPFCAGCNRLRLTADGKMKNCLFSAAETDLLLALRRGEDTEALIRQCLMEKKKETGGQLLPAFEHLNPEEVINRPMVKIGG